MNRSLQVSNPWGQAYRSRLLNAERGYVPLKDMDVNDLGLVDETKANDIERRVSFHEEYSR